MRRLMIKITLSLVGLVFLFSGVSWAGHGSRRYKEQQIKSVKYGECNRNSRMKDHGGRNYHRPMHNDHRDCNHGMRHHRPRHHKRHHVVHHHRPICQHNHYYSGRPRCGGIHLGGVIVDPGWFFSFGMRDRW